MKWFKITLSPDQVENNEPAALRDQFIELYMAADNPSNMALLATQSPTEFYLCCSRRSIPYVRVLTDYYECPPCDKPKHQKLTLLAGNAAHLNDLLQTDS